MKARIQLRRGLASAWTGNNPILALGEFGYEYDTKSLKMGDGVTEWSQLPYVITHGGESITVWDDFAGGITEFHNIIILNNLSQNRISELLFPVLGKKLILKAGSGWAPGAKWSIDAGASGIDGQSVIDISERESITLIADANAWYII